MNIKTIGEAIKARRALGVRQASALLALGTFFLPFISNAIIIPPPPAKDLKFEDVITILNRAVTWFFTTFMIVAVIFVVLAAFKYLTSGGDPEKVKGASRSFLFAAVAIGVALLSISIRFLVQNFLGVPTF